MPQQKLDLFEVAASLAAQLGAGAAEVMGAEALDPDLAEPTRCDHGPDRPIT